MTTRSNAIEHTDVRTGLSYPALIAAFEHELGRWDAAVAQSLVKRAASWSDVKAEADRAGGARGLMIIESIDQGAVTSLSGHKKNCRVYMVGNPAIAAGILDVDPRGAFYVPFRVCLYDDGHPDGAGIYFDRPSSFLAALRHPELSDIGKLLDEKIDAVARTLSTRAVAAE
jgi:uncharacterized protein (DUF302 family)